MSASNYWLPYTASSWPFTASSMWLSAPTPSPPGSLGYGVLLSGMNWSFLAPASAFSGGYSEGLIDTEPITKEPAKPKLDPKDLDTLEARSKALINSWKPKRKKRKNRG